ncbi:MAG: nuclear transport factor 2 family protein [Deltaproteobacteria bacterium]|nr:nuclear transport factor 2 family protein [Deltaproteobacteria bacterium]
MDPIEKFHLALSSPVHVGAKNREAWVGLFHPDGFVEDPVEAGRYQGTKKIETFWDVFIGPQPSVAFDVKRDFWAGDTLIRQTTVVNITQAHPSRELQVPALICYTLREDRVGSLQAVWEPRKIIAWFWGLGCKGVWALTRHGVRMTAKAGLGNAMSFGGTLWGSLRRDQAEGLVQAIRSDDPEQWEAFRGAEIRVGGEEDLQTWSSDPVGALEHLQSLSGPLSRMELEQLVICGHHAGAFLVDPSGEGAVAILMRTEGSGQVASMTMLWSSRPRVLTLQ